MKLIISGHGDISLGILDAFEMIFGADPSITAIPFLKGEGLPQIQGKFQAALDELQSEEEVLFLVDVFGGTPYNAAAQVVFQKEGADIVTGVNLPIVLEAATAKETMNVQSLVAHLKMVASESVKSFKEEIESVNKTDEEEDLL